MGGIIWLASYPKSGNTWLRAFLHNLLLNPAEPADINQLDQFCFGDSQATWYERLAGRKVSALLPQDIARLRPEVHQAYTRARPDSVFVKTHNMLGETFGVPLITMAATAGALYVVRNPLDLVLSLADHFGLTLDQAIDMLGDPQSATQTDERNVFEFYGTWSQHVRSWAGQQGKQLLVVRYEDMATKPEQSFGRVAGFLGLKPPRARLDKAIRFASFEVLRRQEEARGFRERSLHQARFFRVGRAGQWRARLSPAQVERVISEHAAEMGRFGYVPAEFAAVAASAACKS
ncbi:MAG: sulfotransferase domain-containing protein [Alphaproteobacteria bacterium]|nr:sulfotransferase domain-containing protein [Alphaproteobacteria bacterium]